MGMPVSCCRTREPVDGGVPYAHERAFASAVGQEGGILLQEYVELFQGLVADFRAFAPLLFVHLSAVESADAGAGTKCFQVEGGGLGAVFEQLDGAACLGRGGAFALDGGECCGEGAVFLERLLHGFEVHAPELSVASPAACPGESGVAQA